MIGKFLDLRADAAGGNLASNPVAWEGGRILTAAEVTQSVVGKNVLLIVHGFNVNRKDGITRIDGWMTILQNLHAGGVWYGVLWPGDSRWLPVLDYPFEGGEAIHSGQMLAGYLNEYFGAAASVSFVSHSLGARVVLETIRHLNRPTRRLILMAAAIDSCCLNDEYRDATAEVDRISILASRKDKVLEFAFPIGNLGEDVLHPTHPFWLAALGRNGPNQPYPKQVRSPWQLWDEWEYEHGDYLGCCPDQPPEIQCPVDIPATSDIPVQNWCSETKACWAAAFASTRFR